MKKLIVLALLAFAGIGSGKVASAQARQVKGEIPFDFNAGSTRLSAGEYRITYDRGGLVSFRNLTNGQQTMMFVGSDSGTNDGSCRLIFANSGDRHFLKRAVCDAANVNFFIPTYGREKSASEHAALSAEGRQTAVAMKYTR